MKINKGIGFDVKNEGVSEVKQDSLNYYTDTFEPGQTKQRLKIGREVELNTNVGGNFTTGYFTFNTTGNISITGVGFKPKLVQFNYCDQSSGIGNGTMSETYQFAFDINSKTQIQTQCIYIRNGGGTAIGRAVFVSMDSDGFTINVTLASSTIYVNWIAFG